MCLRCLQVRGSDGSGAQHRLGRASAAPCAARCAHRCLRTPLPASQTSGRAGASRGCGGAADVGRQQAVRGIKYQIAGCGGGRPGSGAMAAAVAVASAAIPYAPAVLLPASPHLVLGIIDACREVGVVRPERGDGRHGCVSQSPTLLPAAVTQVTARRSEFQILALWDLISVLCRRRSRPSTALHSDTVKPQQQWHHASSAEAAH